MADNDLYTYDNTVITISKQQIKNFKLISGKWRNTEYYVGLKDKDIVESEYSGNDIFSDELSFDLQHVITINNDKNDEDYGLLEINESIEPGEYRIKYNGADTETKVIIIDPKIKPAFLDRIGVEDEINPDIINIIWKTSEGLDSGGGFAFIEEHSFLHNNTDLLHSDIFIKALAEYLITDNNTLKPNIDNNLCTITLYSTDYNIKYLQLNVADLSTIMNIILNPSLYNDNVQNVLTELQKNLLVTETNFMKYNQKLRYLYIPPNEKTETNIIKYSMLFNKTNITNDNNEYIIKLDDEQTK